MPVLKTYDLFISHVSDHNEEYYGLISMLNRAQNFKWRNYSVPEYDPLAGGWQLRQQLREQIRPVNVMLILAGMYVNHRDWILSEVELAQEYSKPIIGIYPWGQVRTPAQVLEVSVAMVRWNIDAITQAIRQHSI